jgi:hypothetical protein
MAQVKHRSKKKLHKTRGKDAAKNALRCRHRFCLFQGVWKKWRRGHKHKGKSTCQRHVWQSRVTDPDSLCLIGGLLVKGMKPLLIWEVFEGRPRKGTAVRGTHIHTMSSDPKVLAHLENVRKLALRSLPSSLGTARGNRKADSGR